MSKDKNVCFLCGDLSRGGGTERVVTDLCTELLGEERYNLYIVDIMNVRDYTFFPLSSQITYYSIGREKQSLVGKIACLYRFLRKKRIDILINVDVMLTIYSYFPCKLSKTKNIAWEQFNYFNNIGSRNTNKIRSFAVRHLDYYINLTKGDMLTFKEKFKVTKPITYIYNFVRDNYWEEYDTSSKYLLTAGNFYPDKGMQWAIELGEKIFSKHKDWKWILCGDGLEFEKIKKQIEESHLNNNFILPGRVKNIEEYMRKAAIYVSLSKTEGFGLTILEAQNNRLPVIAFDVPFGPREIVENGVNGYLIEAFDMKMMEDKITFLIENVETRKIFSMESKKKFDVFSSENIIKQWDKILNDVFVR